MLPWSSVRSLVVLVGALAACSSSSSRLDLDDLTVVKHFTLDGIGSAYSVVLDGNGIAYVSDRAGFRSYRLNHGDDAELLATYIVQPETGQANQPLALRGSTLAVPQGTRIALVDVADPAAPRTLSTIELGSTGVSGALAWDGDYLYWGGINMQRSLVTDPTHPGPPTLISAQAVDSMLVEGGHIITSGQAMLTILRLPDPNIVNAAAAPIGMVPITTATRLARNGGALYGTAINGGGVWVADIGTLTAPKLLHDAPGGLGGIGGGIALQGDQMISVSQQDVIADYDISDPLDPVMGKTKILRNYDRQANFDIAREGDLLVIANSAGLLLVAPLL
jgi:hypothetical protein